MDAIKGLHESLRLMRGDEVKEGESMTKVDKAGVLYLHRTGTKYECRDCVMFIPATERCWVHDKSAVIKPYGGCGLFVKGKPQPGLEPMGNVSKLESGYIEEQGGYSCGKCEYFLPNAQDCVKVDKDSKGDDPGKILAPSCCNLWEKND